MLLFDLNRLQYSSIGETTLSLTTGSLVGCSSDCDDDLYDRNVLLTKVGLCTGPCSDV